MAYVMVDIESDGPIPGDYSMVCFGAVIVEAGLRRTFYGRLKPISGKWIPGALAVSGFSREDVMAFDDPAEVMRRFDAWLSQEIRDRPIFVSDNSHNPVDDAMGNAEALLHMKEVMGLKIRL